MRNHKTNMNNRSTEEHNSMQSFRRFLAGGSKERNFAILDPSSYAAEFSGKEGGYPTIEDNMAFLKAFPSDAALSAFILPEQILRDLKWKRNFLKDTGEERLFEETLTIPGGTKRRVIAEKKGTTPWLIETAISSAADFDLVDYYADCIKANAAEYARGITAQFPAREGREWMFGTVLLTAFECYYLVHYPDMPLLFYDFRKRYLKSIRNVHAANMAVVEHLVTMGCELFQMGSAGLELLSPKIFDEAIIPFARETADFVRSLGAFSSYHICGHSRQLLETGRINSIRPTWFETFSSPPCGDNYTLKESLGYLDPGIISKGNLALELLKNGTPEQIEAAVHDIIEQSKGKRHIIGQADATILSGTPVENIRAFLSAAYC